MLPDKRIKDHSNPEEGLIYGRQPVIMALEDGEIQVDKILLVIGSKGDEPEQIRKTARSRGVPVYQVPVEKLNKLTRKNHQGVIAFSSPVQFYRLEDVLARVYEEGQTPLFLLLEGVTDVGNFGAIVRTALGAGVQGVIIGEKNAARVGADALKASAGALLKIPVCREKSIPAAIELLSLNGIPVFGSALGGRNLVWDLMLTEPAAIVLGSEENGISSEVRKRLTDTFILPMQPILESYNVSAAAAMILYEASRQRTLLK